MHDSISFSVQMINAYVKKVKLVSSEIEFIYKIHCSGEIFAWTVSAQINQTTSFTGCICPKSS